MKKFIGIIILALLTAPVFAESKKTETLVVKTTIHCNHCLKCESCGGNITKAIMKNAGIKSVKIVPEENTITVIYKPEKTTPEKIKTSILNAGFNADDEKAPLEAFNKLDGCCKPK